MKTFTMQEAEALAKQLEIDFEKVGFTAGEFLDGLHIELEHGTVDPETNVTNDDGLATAKIVLAHLRENVLYYNENIGLEAWEHALDKVEGNASGKKIMIV